jgi:hypothetical protein
MNLKLFAGTNVYIISFLMVLSLFSSCASGENQVRDDDIIVPVKEEEKERLSSYLVDINSYSTNGAYYQKKYEREIISVIVSLTENYEFDIARRSTGFYFDKKSNITDRLYLGFDVEVLKDNNLDYGRYATSLIKEHIPVIMSGFLRYSSLFKEREIAGLVIGFKWKEGSLNRQVNIWIKKEDMFLARESKITINEMYQRSSITNSEGKIILLPI